MKKQISLVLVLIALFGGVCIIIGSLLLSSTTEQSNQSNIVTISSDGQYIGDSITSIDLNMTINGFDLEVDLSELNPTISAQSLSAETANVFQFETTDKNVEVYLNNVKVNNSTTFEVESLDQEEEITITIKKGSSQRNITLQTLPDEFPTLQFSGYSPSEGDFYGDILNDYGHSYVYKYDNYGNLLFYYGGYQNARGSVMNFEKHVVDQQTYYSFFSPNTDTATQLLYSGITYGEIIILNDQYQYVESLELFPSESNPAGGYVENHDFMMLGENHYILLGALDENIYMSDINEYARIKTAYIQEVIDGEVIYEWYSSDYTEFFYSALEGNDYTNTNSEYYAADYMHINSIFIDPSDNNFIVSFRNQDSVVKIDRESGDIIWTLGGMSDDFNLSETQLFSRQHYATITDDGTLLLFDNGNDSQLTRILEFNLNENTLTVDGFSEFVDQRKFSYATGSVVKTEIDTYVIGWGYGSSHSIVSEIDPNTNEVYCEIIPEYNVFSYRVIKE